MPMAFYNGRISAKILEKNLKMIVTANFSPSARA